MTVDGIPTWTRWREIPRVVVHRGHLRKSIHVALIVGTILFAINQLDVVVTGRATAVVWIKVAVTYLVPFCVVNAGICVATRRRAEPVPEAVAADRPDAYSPVRPQTPDV